MGPLRYLLGVEVARSKQGVVLTQRKYATDLLDEVGLLGSKPTKVHKEANVDQWKEDEEFHDTLQYKCVVGKLIYLTVTRPDILVVVGQIS